ncbi:unnamed protein product [Amoebophrya sp. A25]|nr:unnamed protein product [Amoebophrya sp. A25]|eukprot:GSA25T00021775001.1
MQLDLDSLVFHTQRRVEDLLLTFGRGSSEQTADDEQEVVSRPLKKPDWEDGDHDIRKKNPCAALKKIGDRYDIITRGGDKDISTVNQVGFGVQLLKTGTRRMQEFLARFFVDPVCHEKRYKAPGAETLGSAAYNAGLQKLGRIEVGDQQCANDLLWKNVQGLGDRVLALHPRNFDDATLLHQPFILHLSGVSRHTRDLVFEAVEQAERVMHQDEDEPERWEMSQDRKEQMKESNVSTDDIWETIFIPAATEEELSTQKSTQKAQNEQSFSEQWSQLLYRAAEELDEHWFWPLQPLYEKQMEAKYPRMRAGRRGEWLHQGTRARGAPNKLFIERTSAPGASNYNYCPDSPHFWDLIKSGLDSLQRAKIDVLAKAEDNHQNSSTLSWALSPDFTTRDVFHLPSVPTSFVASRITYMLEVTPYFFDGRVMEQGRRGKTKGLDVNEESAFFDDGGSLNSQQVGGPSSTRPKSSWQLSTLRFLRCYQLYFPQSALDIVLNGEDQLSFLHRGSDNDKELEMKRKQEETLREELRQMYRALTTDEGLEDLLLATGDVDAHVQGREISDRTRTTCGSCSTRQPQPEPQFPLTLDRSRFRVYTWPQLGWKSELPKWEACQRCRLDLKSTTGAEEDSTNGLRLSMLAWTGTLLLHRASEERFRVPRQSECSCEEIPGGS